MTRRGFTLVEAATVFAVIGVVTSVVFYAGRVDAGAADATDAATSLAQTLTAADRYRSGNGGSLSGVTAAGLDTVDVTVVAAATASTGPGVVSFTATGTTVTVAVTADDGVCWYAHADYAAAAAPLLVATTTTGTCTGTAAATAMSGLAAGWMPGDAGDRFTNPATLP